MSTACAALTRVATFRVPSLQSFNLIVSRGSVVDFSYQANNIQSAIVNAANEKCLGGGGVDGAISSAGGANLYQDRLNLAIDDNGIRCKTGTAVLTGPNTYDKLHTSHVIHAVGPNYHQYKSLEEGDILLSSAYTSSLQCAKDFHLEAVAFSLFQAKAACVMLCYYNNDEFTYFKSITAVGSIVLVRDMKNALLY